ncbi:MAG: cell division protein FtsZ [Bacteroidales bacterium]|nr:cell division protein FtsZ [Bacteroidales bacterium]
MKEMIKFDMPKNQSSIIKVIGVGGGGSNAVNHMFRQGIKGVDFIICNTDAQAMDSSPVPTKIQLGEKGLGAGSMPAVGKESARQKVDQIREILEKNTQMLFITAGMGGGTGTGAAPVIAAIAKELGILTVGIVTIPFTFEGKKRKFQADEGIQELRKCVDTLLIICNDKLRELYGDLKLSEAFDKADDVLTTAARGIAEIITVTGYINVDFEDVRTVMNNSGKAIMGCAQAEGENRAIEAVKAALSSPLLNDNEIEGASDVLLYITSGLEEISMDEVTEITDYIQREAKSQAEIIWGNGYDETLGKKISITLIATGFDAERKAAAGQDVKIRHALNDEIKTELPLPIAASKEDFTEITGRIEIIRKPILENSIFEESTESIPVIDPEPITLISKPEEEESPVIEEQPVSKAWKEDERTFVFEFSQQEDDEILEKEEILVTQPEAKEKKLNGEELSGEKSRKPVEMKPFELYIKKPGGDSIHGTDNTSTRPSIDLKSQERIERLRNLSMKLKDESAIEEMENEPAYVRRNVELTNSVPSGEARVSKYSLYEDNDTKGTEIRSGNSFLHDNVD